MTSEFEVIRRHFTRRASHTLLSVGDDCALMQVAPDQTLAVSSDMLVAGRHFHAHHPAHALGVKCAAVNLSDLAAMGATPRWATLAICLPQFDEAWLASFADGFHQTLARFGADWVGGDLTTGPTLTFAVTVLGEVPLSQALRRDGAEAGDQIWVTGTLGDAALALSLGLDQNSTDADQHYLASRLLEPTPRVEMGQALRGHAHAAIDISDGLLGDLGHILEASQVGARLYWEKIPRSPALKAQGESPLLQQAVLCGGDDYELCFTAPAGEAAAILRAAKRCGVEVSCIGEITAELERSVCTAAGDKLPVQWRGFDHGAGL
jgi:thiamine-monophosphate kinase